MRVVFSDALREHGNRGVSRGIHSKPPFRKRVYALNSSPAIARKGEVHFQPAGGFGGNCNLRDDEVELSSTKVSPIELCLGERT
jgi:hypothetical protein